MANMKNILKNGDRFETKYNGWLTVVDYIDSKNVVCQFDATGTKTTVQSAQVRNGLVKDDMIPTWKLMRHTKSIRSSMCEV